MSGLLKLLALSRSAWTPLSLGSKLQFWFDNNDNTKITTSAGNVVSQTDQTGNYTRTVAAPAANPAYYPSSLIDSKKYIRYNGAQGLKLSVNGFNHQQGELFVVFRRNVNAAGITANNVLMGVTQSAASNRFALLSDFANTSTLGYSLGTNINVAGTANLSYANTKSQSDKKIIANFRSDGSSYYYGWDRDTNRSKTFSTGSNNGDWFGDIFAVSDLISFGYRIISSSAVYSYHDEFEVIYCNQVLSDSERTQVINYLNNKHDCYRDISFDLSVCLYGTSNTQGQSITAPTRYLTSQPKSYIRTGTNTFAQLSNSNNEGASYGPELSFMACLSEYFNRDIYLAKLGQGGARFCVIDGSNPVTGSTNTFKNSVSDLYPTLRTEYLELITKMNTFGTNKVIHISISGENDTFYTGDANGFQTNYTEVLTALETYASKTFDYHIINKIRTDLAGTGGAPTRQASAISTVQAAQEAIKNARSNGVLLDMVNYSSAGDGVHFVGVEPYKIGRDAFEFIKGYIV